MTEKLDNLAKNVNSWSPLGNTYINKLDDKGEKSEPDTDL